MAAPGGPIGAKVHLSRRLLEALPNDDEAIGLAEAVLHNEIASVPRELSEILGSLRNIAVFLQRPKSEREQVLSDLRAKIAHVESLLGVYELVEARKIVRHRAKLEGQP